MCIEIVRCLQKVCILLSTFDIDDFNSFKLKPRNQEHFQSTKSVIFVMIIPIINYESLY